MEKIIDKVKLNANISVLQFGNFVFRETYAVRKEIKPEKEFEIPTIYSFPQSTAGMARVYSGSNLFIY